jgi:redox-sensitive bicupin YhaK (pirin superfamily)
MTISDTTRSIIRIVNGEHKIEGGGFDVRRPFPIRALDHVDPFLLLDEAGPIKPNADGDMNFHPHRGFETLTYILSGDILSQDSSGFKEVFHSGDVEWTTAGSGIVHGASTLPDSEPMYGIQLWVNLPAAKKLIPPKSVRVTSDSIPLVSGKGYEARIIAGSAEGVTGPAQTTWPILYAHYKLDEGAEVSLDVPQEYAAMIYLMHGAINIADKNLTDGQLGILSDTGNIVFKATAKTELLLLASKPIGESVARYGPFVMNTREEVFQAFDDFNNGKFPMPSV